jgi:sulfur carrier protein ThiS
MARVVFQGKAENTDAATLSEFLASKPFVKPGAIVECGGEVVVAGAGADVPLFDGAEINVYNVVSGG